MEGFTIIDGVVALVIVVSALLAYSRGLVRESLAIAGWVLAAFLAFMFAPQVQPLVKEVPVLGDFLSEFEDITVNMVLNNRYVELISEGFDMAVRIGELEDSTLKARKLAETSKRMIASPAYFEK